MGSLEVKEEVAEAKQEAAGEDADCVLPWTHFPNLTDLREALVT